MILSLPWFCSPYVISPRKIFPLSNLNKELLYIAWGSSPLLVTHAHMNLLNLPLEAFNLPSTRSRFASTPGCYLRSFFGPWNHLFRLPVRGMIYGKWNALFKIQIALDWIALSPKEWHERGQPKPRRLNILKRNPIVAPVVFGIGESHCIRCPGWFQQTW